MIKDALQYALASAEYCSELRTMLYMIRRALDDNLGLRKYEEEKLEEAFVTLNSLLYKKENDAYRSYFMFSLSASEEDREKAKEIAYQRYLREGMIVSTYLKDKFDRPAFGKSQEEFRADIEKHFNTK